MPAPFSACLWLTQPSVDTLSAEGPHMPMDTTVERNLAHALLDRLALRNRAGGLPAEAKEAAFKVMEAVALLERAGGGQEEDGERVTLFQEASALRVKG